MFFNSNDTPEFSSREIQIIPLILSEMINQQIEEMYDVYEKTIETYRKRLY